jgi:phosphatidylserine decarboxylase
MICREGWPWLIGAAILWGVIFRVWGPAWSLPVVLLIGWLIFLFRDPGRQVPPLPLAVVAPVDGKVTEVVQYHDGVLPGKWTRIAIRTNHLGAYTVRSPIEGSIRDVREEARDVDPARLTCGLWVRSEEQDNVVLLFPGRRRRFAPKSFVRYGERVGQGQRFAYLRLAPKAEVYLPATAEIQVSAGDRVFAGTTVLADLAGN